MIAASMDVPHYSGVDSDAEWVGMARNSGKKAIFHLALRILVMKENGITQQTTDCQRFLSIIKSPH